MFSEIVRGRSLSGQQSQPPRDQNPSSPQKPKHHSPETRFVIILLATVLSYLGTVYYLKSLVGRDDKYLKSHVGDIAQALFLSVIMHVLSFAVVLYSKTKWIEKILFCVPFSYFVHQNLQVDKGADFTHHGSYNSIVYLIAFFIFFGISAVIFACYKFSIPQRLYALKRYFPLILVVLFILFILLHVRFEYVHKQWARGIGDLTLHYSFPGCSIPDNLTPYSAVLPRRIFNFFTGSLNCESHRQFSRFTEQDTLEINCPEGATVVFNPDYMSGRELYVEFEDGEGMIAQYEQVLDNMKETYGDSFNRNITNFNGTLNVGNALYISVTCDGVENFHLHFTPNVTALHRAANHSSAATDRTTAKKRVPATASAATASPPNIVIVMIDSLSRALFHRSLPKTVAALSNFTLSSADGSVFEEKSASQGKNRRVRKAVPVDGEAESRFLTERARAGSKLKHPTTTHHAYEFLRYHVMGFATAANLKMMLSGEMPQDGGLSVLPNLLMDHGYVSAWVPELCQNYMGNYFYRDMAIFDHNVVAPFCHPDYHPLTKPFGVFGGGPYSIEKRCLSGVPPHRLALDYTRGFLTAPQYTGIPKIATTVLNEAHEGSQGVVQTIDEDLAQFVRQFSTDARYNNTVLAIIADHGNHMGPMFLWTRAGKYEHRLPSLFMAIPNHLVQERVLLHETDNIAQNQQAFVTGLELHATLLDLALGPDWRNTVDYHGRGHSLFTPTPTPRGCQELGISICGCLESESDTTL